MRIPNSNYYFLNTYEGSPGIVLLARNTALMVIHSQSIITPETTSHSVSVDCT